jgi:hypothetical protein
MAWPPSGSPGRDKSSPAYRRARDGTSGIEIGAGWRSGGRVTGQEYVGLTLAHPDIGSPACEVGLLSRGRPGRRRRLRPDQDLRGLTGPALAPPGAGAAACPTP